MIKANILASHAKICVTLTDFLLGNNMNRLPNLNALRAFEIAARYESFTQAAQEMGITQAAVSRHIRNLEHELGYALFERGHRSVSLTPDGRVYAERVSDGFATIRGHAGGNTSQIPHRVVIDIDSDLLLAWLLPRLTEAKLSALGVELELRSRLEWPRQLANDTNLALVWGAYEAAGFRCQSFLKQRAFAVCASRLAEDSPRLSDLFLKNHRLIHDRTDAWWRNILAEAGHSISDFNAHLYLHGTHLVLDAAVRGLGVAVGDDVIFAEALRSGRLVRPAGPVMPARRQFFLLDPSGRRVSVELRRVRDWLSSEAAEHAEWQRDQ